MTNINELRRLAQAALTGPDGVSLNWVKFLQDFQKEANPATISELLGGFEPVEEDIARRGSIIDSLGSILNEVANERDALRAKIEAMEKQEPVKYEIRRKPRQDSAWSQWKQTYKGNIDHLPNLGECSDGLFDYEVRALYTLPGAKGE